jgi:crotonobetainyl-CoA:carnitine CoA-transferase CaiB-like acyl-CoA transferase
MAMNVNKRGMILNLKNPQAYAIALELIDASDIFLENYRRRVPERLGLDYATLSARLIYCTVAGWGERGPWAILANIDPYVQAADETPCVLPWGCRSSLMTRVLSVMLRA